ncbi:hypothetical protein N9C98_01370 [Synechococcus sp. AH-224-G16]|nr:hypothetical protein [Synechococcus sp. AH-224-G16]
MKGNPTAQLFFLVGGVWLILSGITELTSTSQGNEYGNWFEETSLLALNQRGQGSLKVGLGLGLLGASALGGSPTGSDATKFESNSSSLKSKQSDGSSDGDFNACVALYLDRGGKQEPVLSNTWTDGKTLTLGNQQGERIGNFYRKEDGWYMTGITK